MAKKLDLNYKLSHRKGKRISDLTYHFFVDCVAQPFLGKKMHCEVIDNVGLDNIKGQCIVVSNHTSRCDYLYVTKAFKKHSMNFVISYTEFKRSHMHKIQDIIHSVPKKNFISDIHAIKEMSQIISQGGSICIFPEGKSSISGTNQPIMPGTGKMFQHFKIPVYVCTISGGYMSNTQWNIQARPGKVQIVVNQLLTVEECKTMSTEEIEERLTKMMYNDDFDWNAKERVKFKGNKTVANKLEEHLFWCPKCHKELTMHGNKNVFKCSNCGNGVTINEYYDLIPLDDTCVVPKNLRVWYELQRRNIYREIKNNPNFCLTEEVTIGMQPNDHYVKKALTVAEVVGKGTIKLTKETFSFEGTKDGKPFSISTSTLNIPTLLLETDSSFFGTFIDGTYYEFVPTRKIATKWVLATEECHRANNGKWKNNIPQQQWIYQEDKESDKEEYYL